MVWSSVVFCYYFSLYFVISFFFFLQYWGLNSGPTPRATPTNPFCDEFLEIGSLEEFAQAGSEP
jgi:hypothetical protein